MTTKPKRKAPAKPAAPKGERKQKVSEIIRLISRWKWLEADQDYQASVAATEEESERLRRSHDDEQEKIIKTLRTLVPQDHYEISQLFKFALDGIKICMSLRCDGADFDMLANILEALLPVFGEERDAARLEGMANMRDFLNRKTGMVFDTAKEPDVMKRIGYGSA